MYKIGTGIPATLNVERLREYLLAAEEGGVDSIWTGEGWGTDAVVQLALAASVTERVKLGTSIINCYSRTPALIAQTFATLDRLSRGRIILGLGASSAFVVEHMHGVPYGKPLTRLREYIDIVNMMLAGKPLHYEGELFQLRRGFTLAVKPIQQHIPIYVAALHPASVRFVARHADGWLPIWTPIDHFGALAAEFRQAATEAGRDPSTLCVRSPGTITITPEPERVREETRGTIAWYIARNGVFYYRHLSRLLGEEQIAPIKRAFDEGGATAGAAAVSDYLVDSMSLATDSVERARERLAEQAAAGVDIHMVSVQAATPQEQLKTFSALMA